MNDDTLIRRLNPVTEEEAARMVSPRTKAEMSVSIMATDPDAKDSAANDAVPARSRPRRMRLALFGGLPLAVATAGAVALTIATTGTSGTHGTPGATTTSDSPTYDPDKAQPAALTFTTEGGYLVVRIKDPLADPARYNREFAAHGMNIKLRLVPASPSVVGGIVTDEMPPSVEIINAKGRCDSGGGSCPIGLKIPTGFRGTGSVTFGRAARPGETYVSSRSAFAAGEALHCVRIRGLTVDQALPVLRGHRVTVGQWHYEEKRGKSDYGITTADRSKIPGNWIVTDADPWTTGQVMLSAAPPGTPFSSESNAYFQRLTQGCPQ